MSLVIGQPGALHVGDAGVRIVCQVLNHEAAPLELDDATSLVLRFERPDGSTFDRTAELGEEPGELHYVTAPGDLDQAGYWHVQGLLGFEGSELRSNRVRVRVLVNAPDPPAP